MIHVINFSDINIRDFLFQNREKQNVLLQNSEDIRV